MTKRIRRFFRSMLIFIATVAACLVYFAFAPHPTPKCDDEEALIYARSTIATVINGPPGVLTESYIKINQIETLGVTNEGLIRCQANFEYSGRSHLMGYTLRGLRGFAPTVQVKFDPAPTG